MVENLSSHLDLVNQSNGLVSGSSSSKYTMVDDKARYYNDGQHFCSSNFHCNTVIDDPLHWKTMSSMVSSRTHQRSLLCSFLPYHFSFDSYCPIHSIEESIMISLDEKLPYCKLIRGEDVSTILSSIHYFSH